MDVIQLRLAQRAMHPLRRTLGCSIDSFRSAVDAPRTSRIAAGLPCVAACRFGTTARRQPSVPRCGGRAMRKKLPGHGAASSSPVSPSERPGGSLVALRSPGGTAGSLMIAARRGLGTVRRAVGTARHWRRRARLRAQVGRRDQRAAITATATPVPEYSGSRRFSGWVSLRTWASDPTQNIDLVIATAAVTTRSTSSRSACRRMIGSGLTRPTWSGTERV